MRSISATLQVLPAAQSALVKHSLHTPTVVVMAITGAHLPELQTPWLTQVSPMGTLPGAAQERKPAPAASWMVMLHSVPAGHCAVLA